jgi:hypothetical protein
VGWNILQLLLANGGQEGRYQGFLYPKQGMTFDDEENCCIAVVVVVVVVVVVAVDRDDAAMAYC